MPKCMFIAFLSTKLSIGGPIIMASNVQQQKQQRLQCVRQQRLQQQQLLHHQQQLRQQQQQQRQQHRQRQHQRQAKICSQYKQRRRDCNDPEQQQQHQQQQQHFDGTLAFVKRRQFRSNNFGVSSYGKLQHFGFLAICMQLLLLLTHGDVAFGEGNVGCHFVRTLCLEGSEVCYDDNIFGKCIPTTGVDVEDIEKTPLNEDQSRLLATMLEELQGAGLGWDHPYVQCRIQGTLFSLQRQTPLPPNLCANLAPTPTEIDPAGAMAFVRFTPPDEDYAEQYFYPPLKKQSRNSGDGINTIFHQLQMQDRRLRHDPNELAHFGKFEVPNLQLETPSVMNAFLETERQRIEREQQIHAAEQDAQRKNAMNNRMELYQILAASEPDPQPYQRSSQNAMDQLEQLVEREPTVPAYVPDELNESHEMYFPEQYPPFKRTNGQQQLQRQQQKQEVDPKSQRSFFRELAVEEGLEQQPTDREFYSHVQLAAPLDAAVFVPSYKRRPPVEVVDDADIELQRQQAFEESLLRNSLTPFEEEAMLASNTYPKPERRQHKLERVFTEGGMLYVPENEMQADEAGEVKQALLANMLGFARHERLDVKKPGPMIGPPPSSSLDSNELNTDKPYKFIGNKEVLPAHIKGSNEAHKKKKVIKDHSDEDHAPHTVDTDYAHVWVNNPIDSWSDGVRIMTELANILHMQGYFTYLTVQPRQISFRVDSNNPEHKTAADIARAINHGIRVKNNILRRLGVIVTGAGVGDKVKASEDGGVSSSRIELDDQISPDITNIMVYMLAGAGAAAVIVIFVTLILIKRHDKKRDKLGGLQTGNAGAESCSKDYQDLCRARMAGKGNAAEPVAGGRITTLSKESDRPPSSRSSTSSWSEEPALTNMDISTGHMVLSYMEDHLRNKGRLQREWEALCRYEAEPSARDAATQPQCATLNRPGAPLPYDHSRVVLNHLANAEGLDYINASTITDHDPRAPAYVAAQGPMPSTLAHFWQMIWEQGAVVIVALCRLQENGEVACARYWPEEGAEVYHIYEVHLVSEHIWCDDYLVRSFYLKNLRTSETRTVTQFHFLSWPQSGVPAQAKALLDFRRKVNKSYRGRSCPIVVHGSSGAGRTGAYILLDLVLGRMNKGAREIDIAATLEHLRDQRSGLVATRQQFEFVLMAVAEEVHAILKALPASQAGEKRELDTKDTTTTTTTVAATAAATSTASAKESTGIAATTAGAVGVLKEEESTEEAAAASSGKTIKTTDTVTKDKAKTTMINEKEKDMSKSTPAKSQPKKK